MGEAENETRIRGVKPWLAFREYRVAEYLVGTTVSDELDSSCNGEHLVSLPSSFAKRFLHETTVTGTTVRMSVLIPHCNLLVGLFAIYHIEEQKNVGAMVARGQGCHQKQCADKVLPCTGGSRRAPYKVTDRQGSGCCVSLPHDLPDRKLYPYSSFLQQTRLRLHKLMLTCDFVVIRAGICKWSPGSMDGFVCL